MLLGCNDDAEASRGDELRARGELSRTAATGVIAAVVGVLDSTGAKSLPSHCSAIVKTASRETEFQGFYEVVYVTSS